MDDAAYKAMTLENNKHIDTMAASIVTLADNVGTTNSKLEDLVEVINTHNVLSERVANIHDNVNDFSKRVSEKITEIEHVQQHEGCTRLQVEQETVKGLGRSLDTERDRIDKIEDTLNTSVSAATIRWGYGGTILAIIAFCSWLMLSNYSAHDAIKRDTHLIENTVSSKIEGQSITNERLMDAIDRNKEGVSAVHVLLNRNYGLIKTKE